MITIKIFCMFACIAVNAFFVACEFSLTSSRVDKLLFFGESGRRGAFKVIQRLESLPAYLTACQLGITFSSIILAIVAEPTISQTIVTAFHSFHVDSLLLHAFSSLFSLIFVAITHMFIGEMIPKSIVLTNPEQFAMILTPLLELFKKVFSPILYVLTFLTGTILRVFGVNPDYQSETLEIGTTQLDSLIVQSHDSGLLNEYEFERITRTLQNQKKPLIDFMIPVEKIVSVRSSRYTDTFGQECVGVSLSVFREKLEETGYSRYPVLDQNSTIQGYIHVKDVMDEMFNTSLPEDYMIPEKQFRDLEIIEQTTRLDTAVRTLRRSVSHLGLVVTEGNAQGLVFLEDLAQSFIGAILDQKRKTNSQ